MARCKPHRHSVEHERPLAREHAQRFLLTARLVHPFLGDDLERVDVLEVLEDRGGQLSAPTESHAIVHQSPPQPPQPPPQPPPQLPPSPLSPELPELGWGFGYIVAIIGNAA